MNITEDIKAKSDQLNASDLMGGPITVCIEGAARGNREQPVVVRISGGHMPWKPSKTALRALAHFWGTDTTAWVGRWVRLYRDPRTLWGGKVVGGIMVQGLSHIDRGETLALPYTKGKTMDHAFARLDNAAPAGAPTANLDALLAESGLTRADVDAWLAANGKPSLTEGGAAKEPALAAYLAGPGRLDAVRVVRAVIKGGSNE